MIPLDSLTRAARRCAAAYPVKPVDDAGVCGERSTGHAYSYGACQWTTWNDADGLTWIVFRGTDGMDDMLQDARIAMKTITLPTGARVRVHRGAWQMLDDVYPQLRLIAMDALRNGRRIVLAGHSLGAWLAVMFAARLGLPTMIEALYLMNAPRPGDEAFRDAWTLANKTWRLSINADWIDDQPPALCGYRHVSAHVVWIDGDGQVYFPPPALRYWTQQIMRRLGKRTQDHYISSTIRALETLKSGTP